MTGVKSVSCRWARLQLGQTKKWAIIVAGLSSTSSDRNHLMAMRQLGQLGLSKCPKESSSRYIAAARLFCGTLAARITPETYEKIHKLQRCPRFRRGRFLAVLFAEAGGESARRRDGISRKGSALLSVAFDSGCDTKPTCWLTHACDYAEQHHRLARENPSVESKQLPRFPDWNRRLRRRLTDVHICEVSDEQAFILGHDCRSCHRDFGLRPVLSEHVELKSVRDAASAGFHVAQLAGRVRT